MDKKKQYGTVYKVAGPCIIHNHSGYSRKNEWIQNV